MKSAVNFKNYSGKCAVCEKPKGKVHIFKFPRNIAKAKEWCDIMRISYDFIHFEARICEFHFKSNQFSESANKRMILKENEIPFYDEKTCNTLKDPSKSPPEKLIITSNVILKRARVDSNSNKENEDIPIKNSKLNDHPDTSSSYIAKTENSNSSFSDVFYQFSKSEYNQNASMFMPKDYENVSPQRLILKLKQKDRELEIARNQLHTVRTENRNLKRKFKREKDKSDKLRTLMDQCKISGYLNNDAATKLDTLLNSFPGKITTYLCLLTDFKDQTFFRTASETLSR